MSIYSNLKELYKDTNDIVNGKNMDNQSSLGFANLF